MTLNNSLSILLLASLIFGSSQYDGSTKAAVTLAGGILKSRTVVDVKKYKRKDCPVCEGKGWYISGDGIKKVDCGYCEPEQKLFSPLPPTVLKTQPQQLECKDNSCSSNSKIIRR